MEVQITVFVLWSSVMLVLLLSDWYAQVSKFKDYGFREMAESR
jgi:hypothetical protein